MAKTARGAHFEPVSAASPRPHALGNRLVIAALVTSPLMYLIELVAPQWVIYVFRAAWVVLVAVAAFVVARERRAARRPLTARSSGRAEQET